MAFVCPPHTINRPLNFKEFEERINQVIFVSATPADYEKAIPPRLWSSNTAYRLVDPAVIVRPVKGQIDDLYGEIMHTVERGERV